MTAHEELAPVTQLRDSLAERAHAALLDAIATGRFREGVRLPSEHELAAQLHVSRATVREALGRLQHQGRITRRPGDGTYVTPIETARFVDELDNFRGVDEVAAEQRFELVAGPTTFASERAGALAARLAIDPGDTVHVVTRTMSIPSGPAIHMVDFVPDALITLDGLRDRYRGVMRPLLTELEPAIAYTTMEITGEMATSTLAERLDLAAGALVLVAEETVFTADHRPIEFSRNCYNPTRVVLRTTQRRGATPR